MEVNVIGRSGLQEQNVAEVVGAISSEGFLVGSVSFVRLARFV